MAYATDRTPVRPGEVRRLIALERHYRCQTCDRDHTTWSRMRSCSGCGEALTHAVIRRAALA